ncbi:protein vein isoform X2 [Bradysia coprophila]|uniref:protein vein isoform X2 n=1 Tax=Bradysia coprophila TaxID=38358 RepID=UPI00187DB684|nr:protein vein isoform X2 [Bradysia coprophila]
MYALVLRKWSLAKILMYLWLAVIMLLVYGCQLGASMRLAPNQQYFDNINDNNSNNNNNNNDPSSDVIWYPNQLISQVPNVPNYENSQIINKFREFNFNLNNWRNDDDGGDDYLAPNDSDVMRSRRTVHERFERVSDTKKRHLTHNNKRNEQFVSPTNDNRSDEPSESLQRLWTQRYVEKRNRIANHRRRLASHNPQQSVAQSVHNNHLNTPIENATRVNDPNSMQLKFNNRHKLLNINAISGRNRRESRHQQQFQPNQPFHHDTRHHQVMPRTRPRRFCSARDPATLAFEAPTVFEGKVRSMSSDRRKNFSVTFEVKEVYKRQPGFKLPLLLRLQFSYRNTSECDIYREVLRPRGYVRDELEQGKVYILFVEQLDLQNFTILGQPLKKTRRVVNDVKHGVSDKYGQRASIESLMANNSTAREGRRIRIVCKVRGQPPPKVTWFKDGRSIGRNRARYQFVHLRKRSELIIKSAFRNDSGLYECRAKNKLARQPVSRSIRIEVLPKEHDVTRPPNNWTHLGSPCPVIGNAFCLNGGTCVFFKDVGEPACKCPDGFLGNRCETKNPTNLQPSPTRRIQYFDHFIDDSLVPNELRSIRPNRHHHPSHNRINDHRKGF